MPEDRPLAMRAGTCRRVALLVRVLGATVVLGAVAMRIYAVGPKPGSTNIAIGRQS